MSYPGYNVVQVRTVYSLLNLPHIQPPSGGGLLVIVPAPNGIFAFGERTVGDGVVGDLVLALFGGDLGDIGFIRSPFKPIGCRKGGMVDSGGRAGTVDPLGVGGSTLSRAACR